MAFVDLTSLSQSPMLCAIVTNLVLTIGAMDIARDSVGMRHFYAQSQSTYVA